MDDLTPEDVVCFHNQRGQAENFIKELKLGFGMEQMTSGDFQANALWFSIGVMAYNLTQAQKLLFMDPEWKPKTVAALRWQLGRANDKKSQLLIFYRQFWGRPTA